MIKYVNLSYAYLYKLGVLDHIYDQLFCDHHSFRITIDLSLCWYGIKSARPPPPYVRGRGSRLTETSGADHAMVFERWSRAAHAVRESRPLALTALYVPYHFLTCVLIHFRCLVHFHRLVRERD